LHYKENWSLNLPKCIKKVNSNLLETLVMLVLREIWKETFLNMKVYLFSDLEFFESKVSKEK